MKLIHVLFIVLPLAAHADTWLSGGEAVIPPAVVVSPDNLGNHTATGTLDLAGNTISNVNRIQAADAGGDLAGDWTLNGSAIGGAAAGDNLGDHVATNTLDLGTNRLNVNVEGGMVPWQLSAILDEGGIYPMPQIRGTRSGSPYAAGLMLAGASDGDVLAWDAIQGWYRPLPGSGGTGDNLGNHTATNTLDLGTNRISVNVEGGMLPWQLGAVLDSGGIYPMPQFRGTFEGSPYAAGLLLAGADDGDTLTYDAAASAWKPTAPAGGGYSVAFTGSPELATAFQPEQFNFWNAYETTLQVYSQAYVSARGIYHWYYTNGFGTAYSIRQARLVLDSERTGYGSPGGPVTNPVAACWLWGSANPGESPGFPAAWSYDPAGRGNWYGDVAGIETALYFVTNIVNSVRTLGVGTQELHFVNGSLVEATAAP